MGGGGCSRVFSALTCKNWTTTDCDLLCLAFTRSLRHPSPPIGTKRDYMCTLSAGSLCVLSCHAPPADLHVICTQCMAFNSWLSPCPPLTGTTCLNVCHDDPRLHYHSLNPVSLCPSNLIVYWPQGKGNGLPLLCIYAQLHTYTGICGFSSRTLTLLIYKAVMYAHDHGEW